MTAARTPGSGALILAIDAGNTRVKWGLRDGGEWLRRGAVATGAVEAIAGDWGALPGPARAIASNVAGEGVRTALERACGARGIALRFIASEASRLGVVNGYRDPGQLGPDRWAGLVAAHLCGPGNQLVVNAGTALTIDALDALGRFRGGLIVPGPALMRRSLEGGTAGLRLTEGRFEAFPATTPDASWRGPSKTRSPSASRPIRSFSVAALPIRSSPPVAPPRPSSATIWTSSLPGMPIRIPALTPSPRCCSTPPPATHRGPAASVIACRSRCASMPTPAPAKPWHRP